ncbi:DedA family protein [Streptomyces sp. H39-S7]|uniref:DedA family protein n=1 Tax=Streptomyces sp. H39-S7 TaxID=3004357 RepID=UPI0022AFC326|nr:VTT domain-containing protein [Streptomyces sp. H39-S7]MCZ4119174.1 VTT domain-containing protein [Streptomyces sp. H39-S7]
MIHYLAETATSSSSQSTQHAVGYPTLFLLVMVGSLVPVIPTGALVSGAAVVAFHQTSPFALALVFGVAALAAFLGDVALYWLGLRGVRSKNGSRLLHRLQNRADPEHLAKAQRQLAEHGVAVLVLSRLIPAGRIPVMLACLLGELPLRRFIRGDIAACLAWAAAYQLIGIVGGSLFPEPWQGVALAVGIAFLVAVVPQVWRRAGSRKAGPADG